MPQGRHFETVLRQDRRIVMLCLGVVIALSWLYLLSGAGMEMPAMDGDSIAHPAPSRHMLMRAAWDPGYALVILVMWWVMMVAMMLPSAAPMILLFTAMNRRGADGSRWSVLAFVAAYVVAWGGFSLAAVAAQWLLDAEGLLTPGMVTTSAVLGGSLLVAAGIWQLTPMKHACLRHCRSPLHFFATGWRPGATGAFRMGLEHGAFCLGCCWVLMVLLFYGGVMNLWWILGLAVYVLIEKIVPAGHRVGNLVGGLLVLWGVWAIVASTS